MANFDFAINVIFKHEGGISDNPHDPGGITNFGITIPFMNEKDLCQKYFGHDKPATRADIRNMSRGLACQIYLQEIWLPNHYDQLSDDRVATKIFDCTVNMGEKWGETFAQQAANRVGANLAVDGQLGPISIAGINAVNPDQFLVEYRRLMEERYQYLILKNPSLGVFLKGWMARAAWPF